MALAVHRQGRTVRFRTRLWTTVAEGSGCPMLGSMRRRALEFDPPPDLVDVVSEKAAIIRGELGRPAGNVSGYCDECSEWSDLLQYDEGTFVCEVCRGESTDAESA